MRHLACLLEGQGPPSILQSWINHHLLRERWIHSTTAVRRGLT